MTFILQYKSEFEANCQINPIKEYLKFLNRLYDITWFEAVYA